MIRTFSIIAAFVSAFAALNAAEPERQVIPAKPEGRVVDDAAMQKVYDEVKTPFKFGVILKGGETNELVDCASVFRSGEHWYMMYVAISNKVGYQTYLASSDDLLHWTKLGMILPFSTNGWDAWQADGGIALANTRWDGTHELEKFDGKYWLSYIGGAKQGYETDPLSIGMAWTTEPAAAKTWHRLEQNPVLSPHQSDIRSFEQKTLYKSQIIHDSSESLGWPFVMFYNGKFKNGHGHLESFRNGPRGRQWRSLNEWHQRRSANRENWRRVGDVLFRRRLAAQGVRYVRLLLRPRTLDEMDRAQSHSTRRTVRQNLRAQTVGPEIQRRGLSFLLRRGHRRPCNRASHVCGFEKRREMTRKLGAYFTGFPSVSRN
jgi:hypothetical protein